MQVMSLFFAGNTLNIDDILNVIVCNIYLANIPTFRASTSTSSSS